MKYSFLLFLILSLTSILAQKKEVFDLELRIDAENKKISVEGNATADFKNNDTLKLVLWKYSSIKKIESLESKINYFFDTLSASPAMYIAGGRSLYVIKPKGSHTIQNISFSYECDMKELKGWANSFQENWIELNYYSAWYPVGLKTGDAKSKIKIYTGDKYFVSGSGIISKADGYWLMEQPWNWFDNVVIVSDNLKSKKFSKDGASIEVVYNTYPEAGADSIISECKFALELFEKLFGKIDSTQLRFAIAPFEIGGGYSRKNFICMRTTQYNHNTLRGIGHEIAHFWWNKAVTSTWEDWLNESFAEYSMLVYFRERFGQDFYNKQIDEYLESIKDTPAIWSISRNDNQAYVVLYQKGAVILHEFEKHVGSQKFFNFLKMVNEQKVSNTNDFMKLVENIFSVETKNWFEAKLKS